MRDLLRALKATADESRLRILGILQVRPLCVCEIASVLGLAQSTVSRHLKLLEESGLLERTRNGLWVEYRLLRADGSSYPGELSAALVRDDTGQPAALIATVSDLSHLKTAEAALRDSEARFRELAELSPQVIFEMSADGQMAYASPVGLERIGFDISLSVYGFGGAAVVLSLATMPYVVIATRAALVRLDPATEEAARSLGRGPWAAARTAVLPVLIPAIGAGALLVFIMALGFFITPALLGGRKEQMISNLIQIQVVDLLNWPFASAMSVILLIATLVVFSIYNRYLGVERLWGGVKT